jgi:ABC-2 type transport system permease protein
MAEAEYRLNMVLKVIGDVIWYATQLSIFEVLFYHAPEIAGWDIHATRVFMGILFIIDSAYMFFFNDNFDQASTLVRKGEFDFILAKPVDSQFMFSMRRVNAVYFINFRLVCFYLFWGLSQLPIFPSVGNLIIGAALMLSGFVVLYCLRFFFAGLVIIFHNASSLTYIWYQFYRLGNRPHALYPPWLRWIVLTIMPVGMIVSVPATQMVRTLEPSIAWVSPVMAMSLFILSRKYWRWILRHYSSASS